MVIATNENFCRGIIIYASVFFSKISKNIINYYKWWYNLIPYEFTNHNLNKVIRSSKSSQGYLHLTTVAVFETVSFSKRRTTLTSVQKVESSTQFTMLNLPESQLFFLDWKWGKVNTICDTHRNLQIMRFDRRRTQWLIVNNNSNSYFGFFTSSQSFLQKILDEWCLNMIRCVCVC